MNLQLFLQRTVFSIQDAQTWRALTREDRSPNLGSRLANIIRGNLGSRFNSRREYGEVVKVATTFGAGATEGEISLFLPNCKIGYARLTNEDLAYMFRQVAPFFPDGYNVADMVPVDPDDFRWAIAQLVFNAHPGLVNEPTGSALASWHHCSVVGNLGSPSITSMSTYEMARFVAFVINLYRVDDSEAIIEPTHTQSSFTEHASAFPGGLAADEALMILFDVSRSELYSLPAVWPILHSIHHSVTNLGSDWTFGDLFDHYISRVDLLDELSLTLNLLLLTASYPSVGAAWNTLLRRAIFPYNDCIQAINAFVDGAGYQEGGEGGSVSQAVNLAAVPEDRRHIIENVRLSSQTAAPLLEGCLPPILLVEVEYVSNNDYVAECIQQYVTDNPEVLTKTVALAVHAFDNFREVSSWVEDQSDGEIDRAICVIDVRGYTQGRYTSIPASKAPVFAAVAVSNYLSGSHFAAGNMAINRSALNMFVRIVPDLHRFVGTGEVIPFLSDLGVNLYRNKEQRLIHIGYSEWNVAIDSFKVPTLVMRGGSSEDVFHIITRWNLGADRPGISGRGVLRDLYNMDSREINKFNRLDSTNLANM